MRARFEIHHTYRSLRISGRLKCLDLSMRTTKFLVVAAGNHLIIIE